MNSEPEAGSVCCHKGAESLDTWSGSSVWEARLSTQDPGMSVSVGLSLPCGGQVPFQVLGLQSNSLPSSRFRISVSGNVGLGPTAACCDPTAFPPEIRTQEKSLWSKYCQPFPNCPKLADNPWPK